jgi:nucleotide-binding universal stress UspA family protein
LPSKNASGNGEQECVTKTIVRRERPMTSDRPTIVVGVDGSDASKDALLWAAGQAALTASKLQVILAWRHPVTYGYAPDYGDVDFEGEARQRLDEVLDEVLGGDPPESLETRVAEGHAAPILCDAAQAADLLVVGDDLSDRPQPWVRVWSARISAWQAPSISGVGGFAWLDRMTRPVA